MKDLCHEKKGHFLVVLFVCFVREESVVLNNILIYSDL